MNNIYTGNSNSKANISVIIPAYNVEKYISEAIVSVINQSSTPREVIIIDDGSTDRTSEIISEYTTNAIVKCVRKYNFGQGEARNDGLKLAKSDYVYFFDSDDLLDPEFIASISTIIVQYSYPDLIFFSGDSFFDNDYKVAEDTKPFPYHRNIFKSYHGSIDYLVSDLSRSGGFFASPCLYISKRELWEKNNISFKAILHEDEEVILRLIKSAKSAIVINDSYFYRRVRAGSTMTSGASCKRVEGYREVINSLIDLLKKNEFKMDDDKKAIKKRALMFTGLYLAMSNDLSKGIDTTTLRNVFCYCGIKEALVLTLKYSVSCLRNSLFKN